MKGRRRELTITTAGADTPEERLRRVHEEVTAALDDLSGLFLPGHVLTFVMRTPGHPGRDMLVTEDPDIKALVETIRRLKLRPEWIVGKGRQHA